MKEMLKRISAIVLISVLITALFAPVDALAADKKGSPYISKSYTFKLEPDPDASNGCGLVIQNCPTKFKVKNLKSSNKKVVTVSWKEGSDCIDVDYKGLGKANISFDIVWGKNKKHLTTKVEVIKYESPVSSIKLGNKEYKKQFKGKTQVYVNFKGTKSYKIKAKAAKNWKLDFVLFYDGKTTKTIKNNSTIKVKNNWNYVGFYFTNTKTHDSESVFFYLRK